MKSSIIKASLLFMLIALASCSKEDNSEILEAAPEVLEVPEAPVEVSTEPQLGEIAPLTGPQKTEVVISGTNFGTDPSKVSVFFNEKEAVVESVSDSEIKTKVPSRAFTGIIKVVVDTTELTGPEFTYVVSGIRVSTFAGGLDGMVDNVGLSARFYLPTNGVFDEAGNLYVADRGNYRIRKITPHKVVSTFVGDTRGFEDGDSATARFDYPTGITIDPNGNLYVTDTSYHAIRKITPEGIVTTLAGGTEGDADGQGAQAQFSWPYGITYSNGYLYVVDMHNNSIRKVTLNGLVTTLAGGVKGDSDGQGTDAEFRSPKGIAADGNGNLYVADTENHKIKKVSPDGLVTTIAGSSSGYEDGVSAGAKFENPVGLTVDTDGTIFISDSDNFKIRSINSEGLVSTVVGLDEGFADGLQTQAKFKTPTGIVLDSEGTLYVMDKGNHKIRTIKKE